MSEWRPIETAPKDGTAVLVFSPYEDRTDPTNVVVAKYKEAFSKTPNVGGWWEYCEKLISDVQGEVEPPPTHWMPLPEPPKE